jgi:hypothetical protein
MNTDSITTISGVVGIVALSLHERGIYPDITGLVASIAAGVFALYTNKGKMPYRPG